MAIDPSGLLRHYHAAINALDFDTIGACFAEDARYRSNGIGETRGRAAIMTSFRHYFARYPDQVAGDSLVETVSPYTARAVWWLKATDATTGMTIERKGEETVTFDASGLIVSVEVTEA